ncbi:DUF3489 domain-containing protein [Falsiroseomonas sp. HC035]|uniref:DUF3489 domain-containing protein n=1 Tax=Falsiroseomonas sp. HC035 TaxID=3390999 RepID=UPI003D31646E
MSHRKILTVAQLLVLNTAAQRPDHIILPLPSTIRVRGATQRKLLTALLALELVEEVTVGAAATAWRRDESDQHIGLRLTAAGLAAAGAPQEVPPPAARDVTKEPAPTSSSGSPTADETPTPEPLLRRPEGKLGQVLQAISAETGATLAEITTLTGWLPHTARAALTGLRQRGFAVHLAQHDGRKAYRLTAAG